MWPDGVEVLMKLSESNMQDRNKMVNTYTKKTYFLGIEIIKSTFVVNIHKTYYF